MRILPLLCSIILMVTSFSCFLRSSGNMKEDTIFKRIEFTFRNALQNDGLYPYDVRLFVSAHENKVEYKSKIRVNFYLQPFENMPLKDKLLFEEYFQIVRPLYNTRQEFIDEYYTTILASNAIADLILYGIHRSNAISSNKDMYLLSFAVLKKYPQPDFNMVRLKEVYRNIIRYLETKEKSDLIIGYLQNAQNALEAIQLTEKKTLSIIKAEISSNSFSK